MYILYICVCVYDKIGFIFVFKMYSVIRCTYVHTHYVHIYISNVFGFILPICCSLILPIAKLNCIYKMWKLTSMSNDWLNCTIDRKIVCTFNELSVNMFMYMHLYILYFICICKIWYTFAPIDKIFYQYFIHTNKYIPNIKTGELTRLYILWSWKRWNKKDCEINER